MRQIHFLNPISLRKHALRSQSTPLIDHDARWRLIEFLHCQQLPGVAVTDPIVHVIEIDDGAAQHLASGAKKLEGFLCRTPPVHVDGDEAKPRAGLYEVGGNGPRERSDV